MTGVAVDVLSSEAAPPGSFAVGELRDAQLRIVGRFAVRVGERTWVEADDEWVMRVVLPDGAEIDAFPEPGAEQVTIATGGPDAGQAPPGRREPFRVLGGEALVRAGHPIVLWSSLAGSEWEPVDRLRLDRAPSVVHLNPFSRYAVESPRRNGPSEFLIVPPTAELEITISAAGPGRRPSIELLPAEPAARALWRYLEAGRVREAGVIIDHAGSDDDPAVAALMGYYLLRMEDERLESWRERWASADLADTRVVAAESLLRQPEYSGMAEGFRLLLQAEALGPPAYRQGVRLLMSRLAQFVNHESFNADGRAKAALARVRAYASAASSSHPLLTFYGSHPARPELPTIPASRVAELTSSPRTRAVAVAGGAIAARGVPAAANRAISPRRRRRIRRRARRLPRDARRLALLLAIAGSLGLTFSESLRKRIIDALFGAEEEFEYTGTTEPTRETTTTKVDAG
jgi:hypothetical protein